ncbi:MAG: undecaprenyl-diphosphatase UppP [Ignavibacteriales bacterium]
MSIFEAIVYGIVQGLGEFLPISSSAHLVVMPWLFGWKDPGLAFDVALHLGTLVAVVVFFWKDWLNLFIAGMKGLKTQEGKLFWFLVAATIPGALIGKLLEDQAESIFRNPALIGTMLIVMGAVMYIADKTKKADINLENIGFYKSFAIGLSQAIAIIPGVSRSGITMSAGRFLGLNRESAARFSFLLSTPIILGAGLLKVKDLVETNIEIMPFTVGVVTSAVIGFLSIKFLLDYLKNKGFNIFVVYRFLFGLILIGIYFIRL